MADIESVTLFTYRCTPMFREPFNSIQVCEVQILARNRAEADKIFYGQSHKFFDQDLNMIVTESMHGYRQTTPITVGVSPSGGQISQIGQQLSEANSTNKEIREERRHMPRYSNGQNEQRINNNFKYHAPKDDQPARYEEIRSKAKELALTINECTPASREQSLAFTALEEAVMHANSAIARNE